MPLPSQPQFTPTVEAVAEVPALPLRKYANPSKALNYAQKTGAQNRNLADLTKSEQQSRKIAACSQPLYSASLRSMLQAHSFLWHYLLVAPNVLLLTLCFLLWRRGIGKQFPVFFAFAVCNGVGELVLYAADVLPSVSPVTYWHMSWANSILEAVLKFALIGEIFSKLFGAYESIARLGRVLIQWFGAILVFAAALAAAYAPRYQFAGVTLGDFLLEQSTFFIECGVLLFIFLFASYFHLHWPRQLFGIALGLSVSACIHLATWGMITNAGLPASRRDPLVLLRMGAFHLAVLVWFYYLLVSEKVPAQTPTPLPENNLALWNRELERLLQQ